MVEYSEEEIKLHFKCLEANNLRWEREPLARVVDIRVGRDQFFGTRPRTRN